MNKNEENENEEFVELRTFKSVRGRGTGDSTAGRFEKISTLYLEEEERQIKTEVFKDTSRTIISYNDSPDLPFNASLNPYRGCEHGCIYCYARPTHEYLGLSLGLDFESKLFIKPNAAQLLETEYLAKKWQAQVMMVSGVTDCYQPIEKEFKLTEQCLEVALRFRNPMWVITKNYLVTRDIELFKEMHRFKTIKVCISITSLDKEITRTMEPRASSPARRLDAVALLRDAGIPVSVNMAPIVPGLTDHEIPKLLKASKEAGAQNVNYTMVRLPWGVKDIFQDWLARHFPNRKDKVLHRIEEVRGGKLNSSNFGDRMVGIGPYAEHIAAMFNRYRELYGLSTSSPLSTEHFRRMPRGQLGLFEQ